MVEAAGQLFCLFRDRLDYAFTLARARGGASYREPDALDPSTGSTASGAASL